MSVSSVCSLLKTARSVTWRYARSFSLLIFFVTTSGVHAETLYLGNETIHAQVAITSQEQQKGLQGVEHLAENEGMLFVFNPPRKICMWMKDVPIDLDVGFFDENGKLIAVRHMKAQTQNTHCSPQPAKWALEMSGDWFQKKHITESMLLLVRKASER